MTFYVPTKVIVGPGTLAEVPEQAKQLGASRAVVVCGKSVAQSGYAEKLAEMLRRGGVEATVFSEVEPDPSARTIHRGAELLRESAADLVVGIGGGSSMDAAKAMAAVATNDVSVVDLEGPHDYPNDPLPIICVATTAGTASEVTPFAVVTDTERSYKFPIISPQIYPKVAVLDPELLATAPTGALVAAGMDALTHAIESYICKAAHTHTQMCALEAIRLIGENLRRLVADPENIEAAQNMLVASNIAGFAFSNTRLGVVHAMALPPGALFGVPHGMANSILLPHGMEFNLIAAEDKFCDIAEALGASTEGLSLRDGAQLAVDAVRQLAQDINAPSSLAQAGVSEEAIPRMAEDAMKSGHIPINPRRVTKEDIVALYHAAMD